MTPVAPGAVASDDVTDAHISTQYDSSDRDYSSVDGSSMSDDEGDATWAPKRSNRKRALSRKASDSTIKAQVGRIHEGWTNDERSAQEPVTQKQKTAHDTGSLDGLREVTSVSDMKSPLEASATTEKSDHLGHEKTVLGIPSSFPHQSQADNINSDLEGLRSGVQSSSAVTATSTRARDEADQSSDKRAPRLHWDLRGPSRGLYKHDGNHVTNPENHLDTVNSPHRLSKIIVLKYKKVPALCHPRGTSNLEPTTKTKMSQFKQTINPRLVNTVSEKSPPRQGQISSARLPQKLASQQAGTITADQDSRELARERHKHEQTRTSTAGAITVSTSDISEQQHASKTPSESFPHASLAKPVLAPVSQTDRSSESMPRFRYKILHKHEGRRTSIFLKHSEARMTDLDSICCTIADKIQDANFHSVIFRLSSNTLSPHDVNVRRGDVETFQSVRAEFKNDMCEDTDRTGNRDFTFEWEPVFTSNTPKVKPSFDGYDSF